jgi:membrane protein implicated in regulation of membrane protease activity
MSWRPYIVVIGIGVLAIAVLQSTLPVLVKAALFIGLTVAQAIVLRRARPR